MLAATGNNGCPYPINVIILPLSFQEKIKSGRI
jgi:hypothetical protein